MLVTGPDGRKGYYQAGKPVYFDVTAQANTPALPGNGARVRLIVAAGFQLVPSTGDFVDVRVVRGASAFTVLRLSPSEPTKVMALEEFGDILLGPIVVSGRADTLAEVTLTEIIFRPESY